MSLDIPQVLVPPEIERNKARLICVLLQSHHTAAFPDFKKKMVSEEMADFPKGSHQIQL